MSRRGHFITGYDHTLFELVDVSLLLFNLVSEATQLFVMNLSVVLHLFLQGSLHNTQQGFLTALTG